MLEIEKPLYLLLDTGSNDRVLCPGKVLSCSAAEFTAEFEEPVTLVTGTDMIGFAEANGRFFQQGVRVAEIQPDTPKATAGFVRVGDITSAEQRQTFRVSVAAAGMEAKIGTNSCCKVVDLSPEGFGAIVAAALPVGSLLQVAMTSDGKSIFTATARVQTVKTLADGQFRYGFMVPDKKSAARKALQQLSALIQRQQLRRMSGAA